MKDLQKILVPVDLSHTALQSILYAAQFAENYSGELVVLYNSVVPLIFGQSAYYGDGIGYDNGQELALSYKLEAKDAQEKIAIFNTKVEELLRTNHISGVKIHYDFDFGSAIPNINLAVENDAVDLIIVGINDKHHPSKLLKNISEKLLRNAKIPVLAIPEDNVFQPFKNAVYATDFDMHVVDEIQKYLTFIKPFETHTHCIHIGTMLNEEQQMDYNLRPYFKDVKNIQFEIIPDTDIVIGLNSYIKENHIQLLALHPHKDNIWFKLFGKNRLENVLHQSTVPVLAVY